ncbi:MAG: hypothetical protein K9J42_13445 [Sulfuritalea sp.]|nr:hypothetical protein [Sulfuritalea sp.]
MGISLDHLENKVEQILAVCASLRNENQALRAHAAGLEAERDSLVSKIDVTCRRLEALATQLPEE